MQRLAARLGLFVAGSLIGLVLAEALVGLAFSRHALSGAIAGVDRFLVIEPNLRQVFRPDPEVVPGVEGESRFETSSWGLRAEEWTAGVDFGVLALGGSTTQCLLLDQGETWPHLVQGRLSRGGQLEVWVGNAGMSGLTTRANLLQIEHLPPQLPRLRAVVLLAGANDLLLRLRRGEAYDPGYADSPEGRAALLRRAFYRVPRNYRDGRQGPLPPLYKRTALWRLARKARYVLGSEMAAGGPGALVVERGSGRHLIAERRKRLAARPLRAKLPDLTAALGEYRRNLERIEELAGRHSLRLLLVTQPTMWHDDLPSKLERLLWLGHGEDGVYYSSAALAEGIARYNRVMLEVCAKRRVECLDLAGALPPDDSVYYDDLHFNEAGAERVAELVAGRLAVGPPFGGQSLPDSVAWWRHGSTQASAVAVEDGAEKQPH